MGIFRQILKNSLIFSPSPLANLMKVNVIEEQPKLEIILNPQTRKQLMIFEQERYNIESYTNFFYLLDHEGLLN